MNRKQRRQQLRKRNKMNQNNENRHKASLQKISNTQSLTQNQNPQEQKATPEQILNLIDQEIKKTETRIDERRSQFISANLNYFSQVAAQLLTADWNNTDTSESSWEERFEVIFDVAFRFTEASRLKSDEHVQYFAGKFITPPPLQDIIDKLIAAQHETVREIKERDKVKQEAFKEIEKKKMQQEDEKLVEETSAMMEAKRAEDPIQ